MVISSRTPEGAPNRCSVCGSEIRIDPSRPPGDAPCPKCGHLLWFSEVSIGGSDTDFLDVGFLNSELRGGEQIQHIGRELQEAAAQAVHKKLLLNFENVSFMSSDMIRKLVMLDKTCKTSSIQLRLCNLAPNVREIFKITKLDKMFSIEGNKAEALASFDK